MFDEMVCPLVPDGPYGKEVRESFFIPGKIVGRPAQFMIDTGCTTSVLSTQVFKTLPKGVRDCLVPCENVGVMADGSSLRLLGRLSVPCRLRSIRCSIEFLVGNLKDDAILGLAFLEDNLCMLDFARSTKKNLSPRIDMVNYCLQMCKQWEK